MANVIREKVNPYYGSGRTHDSGLNYVCPINDGTFPNAESIVDKVMQYFYDSYFLERGNETIPRESMEAIISRAINCSKDYGNYIEKIEIPDSVKQILFKVWDFIDEFRKYAYTDDTNIFNYEDEFDNSLEELEDNVLNSDLTEDEKILPLVGLAVLRNSFSYWKNAYNNADGSNGWNNWITEIIGGMTMDEFNWEEILQNDLAGGIIGALQGFINGDNFQAIIIGGAAGSIATAFMDISVQLFNFIQETEGLLRGGESVEASDGHTTKISKRVVEISRCNAGQGVTLPRAKSGNVMFIKNNGNQSATVAALGTDKIDGSASIQIDAHTAKTLNCAVIGNWISN